MVHLSGIEAADMIGKKDHEYAVPFFGRKVPMLVDMVNEDPVVSSGTTMRSSPGKTGRSSRQQGRGPDGADRILWMKASFLYDGKGIFVGTIGGVRDITHTVGTDLLLHEASAIS